MESKVYRLSAHGNLIAPPGVPLHYPEHEAITVFGNREEYEAALRGDPVPRFRARLVEQGTLSAERADEIAQEVRDEMEAAVAVRARQPVPGAGSGPATTSTPRPLGETRWHERSPTSRPSNEAIQPRDGAGRDGRLLRPGRRPQRRGPARPGVRPRSRARLADLRDRRDRDGGRASRSPATGRSSSC